jgi:thiamine biosynthesis protein ThiS
MPDATVTANGRAVALEVGETLHAFLRRMGFEPRMVVVERNGEALTPAEGAATRLLAGDRLEIVRIVAGG